MKFHVEDFIGVSTVCDENGYNGTQFGYPSGAVFTTHDDAAHICSEWNAGRPVDGVRFYSPQSKRYLA